MPESAQPRSLQHLPQDPAGSYVCSASAGFIMFYTDDTCTTLQLIQTIPQRCMLYKTNLDERPAPSAQAQVRKAMEQIYRCRWYRTLLSPSSIRISLQWGLCPHRSSYLSKFMTHFQILIRQYKNSLWEKNIARRKSFPCTSCWKITDNSLIQEDKEQNLAGVLTIHIWNNLLFYRQVLKPDRHGGKSVVSNHKKSLPLPVPQFFISKDINEYHREMLEGLK